MMLFWSLLLLRLLYRCYLWNRANFEDMRVALSEFNAWFCDHYCNDTPTDFLRISIRRELLSLLDKYVPSKMLSIAIVDSHGLTATSSN